ncbi:monofunctional biosynthetic peptidoglycan transglycosylase [Oleispirillum naphthae]|uniref:monofunctional biosynthetic peptidoglycan transglycosylase n=1 Tax=Oleispirillum naphthae TaxID=2838853 RepID=UPI0030824175
MTPTSKPFPWRAALRTAALVVLLGPPVALALFRVLPVPATPLMLIRLAQGEGLDRTWVPLSAVSPHLRAAVIAAEDNRFCTHWGFDLGSLQDAVEDWDSGKRLRGASTISMQTAKNFLLWPGRDFLRKGLEAYATLWMELLWPKTRIAEVYLNIAEWGPGTYGAEAAARRYFKTSAARLSRRQAALLAATLPSPRNWSPAAPSAYVAGRAAILHRRMAQLGPDFLGCIGGKP